MSSGDGACADSSVPCCASASAGIALAKQRGAYRGSKRSLGVEGIAELTRRITGGKQHSQVARDMGICRETLYRYLRRANPTV